MFLTKEDLGQVIYDYQVEQITEGNDDLVLQALAAGEEETRSYLEPNLNKKDSMDGRLIYDTDAIFSQAGTSRNALILQHAVTISKYHLIHLCNVDALYEQAEERYDRATSWLVKLSKGDVTIKSLPKVSIDADETATPYAMGSRTKFNHE